MSNFGIEITVTAHSLALFGCPISLGRDTFSNSLGLSRCLQTSSYDPKSLDTGGGCHLVPT